MQKPRALTVIDAALREAAEKSGGLGCLAMALMAVPVVIDVALRYFTTTSVRGIIEVEEFFLATVVFLCLAAARRGDGHISVDLLVRRLDGRIRAPLNVFVRCTALAYLIVLVRQLGLLALRKYASGEYSPDLMIPLWPFQAMACFGCLILTLAVARDALRAVLDCLRQRCAPGLLLALALTGALLSLPWWIHALPLARNMPMLGLSGFAMLMAFILMGMPIGYAMGITGVLGMLTLNPSPAAALSMVGMSAYHTGTNYTYTVIPLFILMGAIAFRTGISRDIFTTANIWFGRLPGGLAIASVAGCAGFAAVCGDSLATAVTMGSVALPEMRQKNYEPGLACACLAAGGTLGILIPPSIGFIFYALVTEESIGRLFIAGIIPGLLMASLFCGILLVKAIRHPHLAPAGEATSFAAKLRSLKGILPMLGLMALIIGGILGGFCSPTEGGAIGAAGAFLYALCSRRMSTGAFIAALKETTDITAKLMLILIGVHILGFFMAGTRIPFALAEFTAGLDANRYVILALIVAFYIFMGCLMNVIPLILLTLPAIYPTVLALDFDPVWFGVITVILMEMGQITPPIGVNVFAISTVAKDVPMERIFRNIMPMFTAMLVCIFILVLFPGLALWLPGLLIP